LLAQKRISAAISQPFSRGIWLIYNAEFLKHFVQQYSLAQGLGDRAK
jgi:hypothetical protein